MPIIGGLMNAQYKSYQGYLKGKRVITGRTKSTRVGGQLTTVSNKINLGKSLTRSQMVDKLVNANKQKIVFRFTGVNAYSSGRGYYLLENADNALVSPVTRNAPLYAFDLTSCINVSNTTATVRRAVPLCSMYQTIANGDVDFADRVGLRSDGVTTDANLQMDYSSGGGDASASSPNDGFALPLSKDLLKWVSIKLNCYGIKTSATTYKLMLVRFTDRDLIPHSSVSANVKRTNLFQSLIKPFVFNPMAHTTSLYAKRMQVLRQMTFTLQDQSSTSLDTDANSKVVNMFVRLNRICNYTERANNFNNPTDTADQADYTVHVGQQNNEYVQPTSRIFLIIVASNYGKDDPQDAVNAPSFDLTVRMCHENFN